jgi:hypothetical protein
MGKASPMNFAPRVIMCAKCGKPVERIEQFVFWENTENETIRIRVHCHGEIEHEDVRLRELVGAINFTAAFRQPFALPPWRTG